MKANLDTEDSSPYTSWSWFGKIIPTVNELRAGECGVIHSILIGDGVALLWCQSIDASVKNSSAIDWSKTFSSNPLATLSAEFFISVAKFSYDKKKIKEYVLIENGCR